MEVITETGDISKSLWSKLLDITGRDTFTLWVIVPFTLSTVVFWLVGGIYLFMDITKKPAFLQKYRMQPGTNEPLDSEKVSKLLKRVLFNQFCLNIPLAIFGWVMMKDRMGPEEIEIFPSPSRLIIDQVLSLLVQEIAFYYTHRLFHHPVLYKHIHKTHHEWTSPIAISAIYCHPIEHIVSNVGPVFLGLYIINSHPASAWIRYTMAILITLHDHSDYHFPLLPSPESHDFHHLKFNTRFGARFGFLDRFHGTDDKFRTSREFDRHNLFLTIASQREKFPDIAEKSS